jgi:allantoate deiminase/N-carbamoyl-L-amino-acid hydrolase
MYVNKKRFENNLMKIGKIGQNSNGGIDRTAFSDNYYKGVEELVKLFKKAKLKVKIDKIGNVIAKREGKDETLPSIIIGSHLDTVPNGGIFDGTLGVISGLECINMLNDNNEITKHPIEIIAFNAEEGSDMGGTFGSRIMMGNQDLDDNHLLDKINNYNLSPNDLIESKRETNKMAAYLELHIEQGLKLKNTNCPIGIVKGIVGITRYRIIINGQSNHAGTTAMDNRKDSVMGAAHLIKYIEEVALSQGDPFVATIGDIKVYPGVVNVIPNKVDMLLEFRDLDQSKIEKVLDKVRYYIEQNLKRLEISFEELIIKPPIELDKKIINILKQSSEELKLNYVELSSGAGHDAKAMAKNIPTGMIFVPSNDGRSHCKEEWTDLDDCINGVKLLYNTLLKLDEDIHN